jgi:hypothetical protein
MNCLGCKFLLPFMFVAPTICHKINMGFYNVDMSCVRNGVCLRKVFMYLCTEYGSYLFEEMLE